MTEISPGALSVDVKDGEEQVPVQQTQQEGRSSQEAGFNTRSALQELEGKRGKLIERLVQVKNDPADTVYSPADTVYGERYSQAEYRALLEKAIDQVESQVRQLRDVTTQETELPPSQEQSDNGVEAGQKLRQHFIRLGEVSIPLCHPPDERREWRAFVAKMRLEGGKKWADVFFEKTHKYRPSEVLRPGDPIPFSEKRGERIEAIDNLLEGAGEVRAFNEILARLAQLQQEYNALNPDDPDYDQRAIDLASQIAGISQGNISEVLGERGFGIVDIGAFSLRVREIISTQSYLRKIDTREDQNIPEVDPKFKLTPFYQQSLQRFAQLANRQLGLGNNALLEELVSRNEAPDWEKLQAKGMTLVIGPKGTGKNKLAEHYAAISRRQLFRYACSPHKSEYDLTYDITLKDGEVVKIPSRIIEAVTTQDALLELDEVNLLDPAVAKFFNSLLDHDRALFLNNEIIRSAPGVLIVGLMNPADYEGVKDLPETIDDRSNGMRMDYPPLKTKDARGEEIFTYDEAVILKEHISVLQRFTDEEFIQIWDHVVNRKPYGGRIDPEVAVVVKDLKNIITIADRTRTVVKETKTRTGGSIKMTREISLRGAIDIVKFYSENHLWQKDVARLPDSQPDWNAAAYAVAAEYVLPRQGRYRRSAEDRINIDKILREQVSVS